MTNFSERLSSVEEASVRLGISTFTMRRLIKARQVRSVRIAKRVLIPESEIERIVVQGCGKHASRS
jgi:excisionase family DNA binding protein